MSMGHVVSKHLILLSYPDARSCLGLDAQHASIHASPADPQDAVPYALFSSTSLESGLGYHFMVGTASTPDLWSFNCRKIVLK